MLCQRPTCHWKHIVSQQGGKQGQRCICSPFGNLNTSLASVRSHAAPCHSLIKQSNTCSKLMSQLVLTKRQAYRPRTEQGQQTKLASCLKQSRRTGSSHTTQFVTKSVSNHWPPSRLMEQECVWPALVKSHVLFGRQQAWLHIQWTSEQQLASQAGGNVRKDSCL